MMIPLNTAYLNRSANKTLRENPLAWRPEFVVWHETAGFGSLDWNLINDGQRGSFSYLINRAGVIYHYIDERTWIAWGAGVRSRWTIGGRTYINGQINERAINVEIEGANDGTPITAAQVASAITLLRYFQATYSIPLENAYHPEHADVAPGYKTDGRGYDIRLLVQAARRQQPLSDRTVIGAPQYATLDRIKRALERNQSPLPVAETPRIYQLCEWFEVDMSFLVGVWRHEGGRPLGGSVLQRQTRNPINIKAAIGEWRPTARYNGSPWHAFESWQLGLAASVIHLKNVYGAAGQTTVRQIVARLAPASDGNDVEAYVASVLEDMAYIRSH